MPTDLLHALASNVWTWFLIALFFGGSIFVHELGHFLAARWRGVHVERFSIGFGPKILSWHRHGVEYRLSWLPFGGYVLLPQLADLGALEGKSTADVTKLPPISYTSKIIVFVAGAAFNVLFAFALASIVWLVGQPTVQEDETTRIGVVRAEIETSDGRTVPGPAAQAGLQVGDVIQSIDGKSVTTFSQLMELIAFGSGRGPNNEPKAEISFERSGRIQTATVFPQIVGTETHRDIGAEPAVKVAVASVQANSPAEAAGLQPGDIVTQLDGQPVGYVSFISDYLKSNHTKPMRMTFLRNGHEQFVEIQPRRRVDPETKAEVFRIGVVVQGAPTEKIIHVPPWTQLEEDVLQIWRTLASLLNPHSSVGISNLSGAVGIVHIFHAAAEAGLLAVVIFTIFINVDLAILNLMPFPVLDGGQIVFAAIGKLRGRSLPINLVAATQGVFLVLIVSLALYLTAFDVRRWVRDANEEKAAATATATPLPTGK